MKTDRATPTPGCSGDTAWSSGGRAPRVSSTNAKTRSHETHSTSLSSARWPSINAPAYLSLSESQHGQRMSASCWGSLKSRTARPLPLTVLVGARKQATGHGELNEGNSRGRNETTRILVTDRAAPELLTLKIGAPKTPLTCQYNSGMLSPVTPLKPATSASNLNCSTLCRG